MYTGNKWFVPKAEEFKVSTHTDEWGHKETKIEVNYKMTYNYKNYLNNVKPLEDMKKEYYMTKKSCQYQLVHYGEIDQIDITRLESLKKRISQWLYRFKSVSIEDAKEFWGWTEK